LADSARFVRVPSSGANGLCIAHSRDFRPALFLRLLYRAGGCFVFPAHQTGAHEIFVKVYFAANVAERERPLVVIIEQPTFRVHEQLLACGLFRGNVILEAKNGIFQNCKHQAFFRLP
jgi:hypothetical protein